jgi:plasmid stabilization system protein ParE
VSGYALHPDALVDLEEIWDFIATDNIAAADRVIGEIFDTFRTVATSKHVGHRRPDLTAWPMRFVRVRDYLVAYAPDEDPVWVLAVIHGRRNPRVMSAILRGREG